MSFYDQCRWEEANNYNFINFFRPNLDADTKILTHWLSYITDRQMPFKRIWDIGGFVFSEMVYELKRKKTLDLLNPEAQNSFIEENGGKFTFISQSAAGENRVLAAYGEFPENERVTFKSRFFPSDYMAILYTLVFLEDYGYSFSKFIKEVYCRHKDKADFIKRILFSLSLVTYEGIGQPKSKNIKKFASNERRAKERKDEIKRVLDNAGEFNRKYSEFLEGRIYNQKRAWCSLRDYLKSPVLKEYFRKALRERGLCDDDFKRLFSYQALTQLELPGDVWNNNSKFRKCILRDTAYEDLTKALNRILREFYDTNHKEIDGYPEQFDITFDFVPRMCEKNNCTLCPIYKLDNEENYFSKICIQDESKFCPVALISCNYKSSCKGKNNCKLI
ncbi:MAG: hypothetical protein WHS88_09185 [Anaerohalosphaeraceae bacterium]